MRILTAKDLAAEYGVTPQTVTAWCRAGLVDGASFAGGQWVIPWSPFLMSSLPRVRRKLPNGQLAEPEIKRGRGRPKGSKNKKPYPKRKPKKQSPR